MLVSSPWYVGSDCRSRFGGSRAPELSRRLQVPQVVAAACAKVHSKAIADLQGRMVFLHYYISHISLFLYCCTVTVFLFKTLLYYSGPLLPSTSRVAVSLAQKNTGARLPCHLAGFRHELGFIRVGRVVRVELVYLPLARVAVAMRSKFLGRLAWAMYHR